LSKKSLIVNSPRKYRYTQNNGTVVLAIVTADGLVSGEKL